jgi:Pvc16 N-terminal domain
MKRGCTSRRPEFIPELIMIDDIDATIAAMLSRPVPGGNPWGNNITFEVPAGKFDPPPSSVNFFLYDIRENRELRGNGLVENFESGGELMQRPAAVRLDCTYLVTAWAGDIKSEHWVLGQLIRALLRFRSIPFELLQGSLVPGKMDRQDVPLPTTVLQPGNSPGLGELWHALGKQPRAAVHYTVTAAVYPFEASEIGPLVKETVIKVQSGLARESSRE